LYSLRDFDKLFLKRGDCYGPENAADLCSAESGTVNNGDAVSVVFVLPLSPFGRDARDYDCKLFEKPSFFFAFRALLWYANGVNLCNSIFLSCFPLKTGNGKDVSS
jgi:hypothetical protein